MKPSDKNRDKNSVEVTRLKGSGPGGQNRNKRETGIRLKHLPSGVVVNATERRSQGQNLEVAFERLESKLEALAHRPAPRRKSKPSAGVKKKRVENKRHHARKKQTRSRNFDRE